MSKKVDLEILKYYQASLKSYESASENNKYEEALKTIVSLNKNGIKVCFHTSICYIIEKFVQTYPTPEIIGSLFRAINNYLEGVIVGKNTSRLLEKVLKSSQIDEVSDDEIVQFQARKFCDYMWIHYPDNLENNIGSHIVRLFFQFVCGVYVNSENKVYSSKTAVICKPMQENYLEKLYDLIERFLLTPHITQLLTNEYMSSTLQILLVISSVRCPEKYETITEHIMSVLCNIGKNDSKKKQNIKIPESFHDKYQSFFIECMIANIPKGSCLKLFIKTYLKRALPEFIENILVNPNSCGIFKTAVSRVQKSDILLEIVQQLKISLYKNTEFSCGNVFLKLLIEFVNKVPLFSSGDPGVFRSYKHAIIEIIQFLSKEPTGSYSLPQLLMCGLKDHQDVENDDVNDSKSEKTSSLWASMLIQAVLDTFAPIPKTITKLFSSLSVTQLQQIADDSRGSRTIDTLFKSDGVHNDIKYQLLDTLSPSELVHVACSRTGSRVLDTVWSTTNASLIELVKTKLENERLELRSHVIGRFIESKFFGYVPKSLNSGTQQKKKDIITTQKRPIKMNNGNEKKRKKTT